MASIGSLTVDLTLKSVEFINNLNKAATATNKNSGAMRKSVEGVQRSFEAFIGVRTIKQIANFIEQSVKLAATVKGSFGAAARTFVEQAEVISNSFQLGTAAAFMDTITQGANISGKQIAQLGVIVGDFAGLIINVFIDAIPKAINASIQSINSFIEWFNSWNESLNNSALGKLLGFGGSDMNLSTLPQLPDIAAILVPGTEAMAAYSAALTVTTEGQKQLNYAAEAFNVIVAESEKLYKETRTPLEEYDIALGKIAAAHATGELATRAHTQAVEALAGTYVSAAGQITQTLAGAFAKNKAFAIANAVMNVAEGITSALKLPFPLNWAQVAAVTAAGIAQIQTIQSAQPGTSKTPKASKTAAASATSSGSVGGGRGTSQAVTINLMGQGGFTRDQVRQLAEQLNGLVADGATISVS